MEGNVLLSVFKKICGVRMDILTTGHLGAGCGWDLELGERGLPLD